VHRGFGLVQGPRYARFGMAGHRRVLLIQARTID
jgi:hypothetical protein